MALDEKRGVSLEINVDVSEALTGLKAVQREARKAAQELKELEAQAKRIGEATRSSIGNFIGPDVQAILHRGEKVIPRKEFDRMTQIIYEVHVYDTQREAMDFNRSQACESPQFKREAISVGQAICGKNFKGQRPNRIYRQHSPLTSEYEKKWEAEVLLPMACSLSTKWYPEVSE